ncbi:MAG: hypothetical protein AAFW69_12730 [Pseudomonadota bacterium]
MADPVITFTELSGGTLRGTVAGAAGAMPELVLALGGVAAGPLTLTEAGELWAFEAALPPAALAGGSVAVSVVPAAGGPALATLTLASDAAGVRDLNSEVAALRAELDILKAAFRREMARGGGL